jgi:hypothetical protein
MARTPETPSRAAFPTPIRFDWTDEKLQILSQEQLLNLLENLDHQRAIGRMSREQAGALEPRIMALLTARNGLKRRKQLAKAAAALEADASDAR